MTGTMSDAVAGSDDPGAKRRYWPIELDARFAHPQFRGQGGMGRVWAAYDNHQRRQVAVKVMREDVGQYAESLKRFQAEAARMQQVPPHPNVIEIYDYGTIGDWCFLTMPLLSGPHMGQQDLPVQGVLDVIRQTAAGLAHLHTHRLVHRDVKPSNLVFDGPIVKIVDFGIAKAIDVTPITKATAGTEGYMAPELRDPRNEVTPAVDIYSLGCVLFERLTGVTPGDVTVQLQRGDRHGIPRALRPLVDAMLATDPSSRPTATQVQGEVVGYLAETVVQHAPGGAQPPQPPRQPQASLRPQPPPQQQPLEPRAPAPRTHIVPVPEVSAPPSAPSQPSPTAVAAVPVAAEPVGPVQGFVQEWFTPRGHFGRESLSGLSVVVAVGAWLLICLGGVWVLSLVLLLLLRLLGVG